MGSPKILAGDRGQRLFLHAFWKPLLAYSAQSVLPRQPAAGEVRVRVMAAGVNPVDEMVRSGELASYYEGQPWPFVPGMDIAGVVDKVGPEVEASLGLTEGMDVTGLVSNAAGYGGYSEYVCLPARSVIPMPGNTNYAEASAFLMTAMTARTALDDMNLPAGSSVLVIGAAGAVGAYACVLADRDGLEVVGVASPSDQEALLSFGVQHFVPRGDDANEKVRQIFPEGVDGIIDTAGLRERAFPALKDGGKYIALRFWDDPPAIRGIDAKFVSVRDRIDDHPALLEIGHLVERGGLAPAHRQGLSGCRGCGGP